MADHSPTGAGPTASAGELPGGSAMGSAGRSAEASSLGPGGPEKGERSDVSSGDRHPEVSRGQAGTGLGTAFAAMVTRDLRLAIRRPGDLGTPIIFFLIVTTLFPFAVSPEPAMLRLIGPGVLWVAALLAMLLGLAALYRADHEDGTLEQLLLAPQPLSLLALAKTVAQWLVTGLPLVLVSPLAGVSFGLGGGTLAVLAGSLALGTACLSLLGAIGAALTVGLRQSNALVSLLVLPLAMPMLILGTRAVSLAAAGDSPAAPLYYLAALGTLGLTLAPFAAAAALRISLD